MGNVDLSNDKASEDSLESGKIISVENATHWMESSEVVEDEEVHAAGNDDGANLPSAKIDEQSTYAVTNSTVVSTQTVAATTR